MSDNHGWAQLLILTSTLDLKQISVLGSQWDCVHSDRLLNKDLEKSQMAGLGRRSSGFSGGGGHHQGGQESMAVLWWGQDLTVGYATDLTLLGAVAGVTLVLTLWGRKSCSGR